MREPSIDIGLVGIISDTHGLLREEAIEALRGCDLIIHAGDIGRPEILDRLNQIAPLTAVKGNIDTGVPLSSLPATAVADGGSIQLYVLHDIADLDLNPAVAGFAAVVSGHSHQPGHFTKSGVLYINPGSAGPRRFKLPVTLARLNVKESPLRLEFVNLLAGEKH